MDTKQLTQNLLLSFKLVKQDIESTQYSISQSRIILQNFEKRLELVEEKLNSLSKRRKASKAKPSKVISKTIRIAKVKKSIKKNIKRFVASKTGNKVHIKSCVFAKNILPKRKTYFASKIKALNIGFKACECLKA